MANMEAWTTGAVTLQVEGGHLPVTAAVEVLRVSELVHVIARADSDDPDFAEVLPAVFTSVERYPKVSVARDPLAELGERLGRMFFDSIVLQIRAKLGQKKAAIS
jgi:hypothetical protein